MKKWECTTAFEIEQPWTDSLDYGPKYYKPVCIVLAPTRGIAKAIFADEFDEIEFIDVRARRYYGDEVPDLPYDPYDLTDKPIKNIVQGDGWILYETDLT